MNPPMHSNRALKPPDPSIGGTSTSAAIENRSVGQAAPPSAAIGSSRVPASAAPAPPSGNPSSIAAAPPSSAADLSRSTTISPGLSYAKVVAGSRSPSFAVGAGTAVDQRNPRPRFPPLSIPARQVENKDGKPAISFSGPEIVACEKRFEHSIVAKFTFGRPHLAEIQKVFQSSWRLSGRASLSDIWDSRHVLVIFDSEEDVRMALSSPLNKVGHAYFRLFRWSPDYNPKKESTVTTIWVRLPGLPLSIYDSSFIEAIISTFGYFVSVDDRTKACTALKFARACVELDVTKAIPESVWINMPDNRSYWQPIEVESKLAYCNRCKVHGHSFETCRRRKVNMEKKGVNESTSKEDQVSKVQETTHVEVVHDKTSQDHLAVVVFNDTSKEDESSSHARPENSEIVLLDEGQSSKPLDSPAPTPAAQVEPENIDMERFKRDFDMMKNELAAEGVFAVPEEFDDDFILKWNRAVDKYESTILDCENDALPISEWTISKKKKKKNKHTRKTDSDLPPSSFDVRRSSRVRQATEVKNPDFTYHGKGM